ncbi:MAG: S9 family peptidase [Chlorobiota bacterium]
MKIKVLLVLIFVAFLTSCDKKESDSNEPANEVNKDYVVEYEGREVNLEPYFKGFPYSNFHGYYKSGKLFYYKSDSITSLHSTNLDKPNFEDGKQITDINYSLRNVWSTKYNDKNNSLYWIGDEVNDEKLDIFKLNLDNNELEKLTDVPYIFGWNFNKDKSKIAYVVRLGNLEKRLGELRIMDTETNESVSIVQDSPDYRFTWGAPSFSPNGKYVVLPILKGTDRTRANVMLVDIEAKTSKVITDDNKERFFPDVLSTWVDNGKKVLYLSNENGYKNLFSYDVSTGKTEQVTKFEEDISNASVSEIDGEQYVIANTENPIESTLYMINPVTSDVVASKKYPYSLSFLDSDGAKLMVSLNGATTKFRIDEITLSANGFSESTIADLPEELKEKIVNAEVEKLEIPTFDKDPKTGETRMLHAFLYKPKNPLPKEKQRVLIQSFYGGSNKYNVREHILTNAGIYLLSPSPRGSSGFGKDFFALNDKDLGGNEIIDIIETAKYISEKLDIPAERIGVFGGSHGGYATMRLLTFPGEVNGIKEDFDFGFGIAHAGFSDIIHFYEHCNIPDWVTLEAGDPATEAEKLNSRSPLYNAYDMEGRLLLTHGTNDSRVPIEGSRFMADSLKKYNKNVTLQEYEGMGHHIKGLENNVRQYKTWFDFLQAEEK